MISIHQAEEIHKVLIERFGGGYGVRDAGLLTSALQRPFQTFGSVELYPSVHQKAAALIESILINHPFIDGNKRTGYVLTRLLLLQNGYDIEASQQDKYDFVIGIASGQLKFDDIVKWLESNTVKAESSK